MNTVFAAGKYLSWGVLSISLTNLLLIIAMVAIFGLALVVPFPRERGAHQAAAPKPDIRPDGGDS